MKFDEFVRIFGSLPVIETENLFTGGLRASVKVQISRWEHSGKIIQLKRGIYVLAEPYRKVEAYEPFVASILKRPSYLSLEKALEYYNLIPEGVPAYTSVTTKRPAKFISPLGSFDYRHIDVSLFWGYDSVMVNKQTAFVASPEKALLDLVYLKAKEISLDYLEGLRLQGVERIRLKRLFEYAKRFEKPKMLRAASMIRKYTRSYSHKEKIL